MRRKPVQGVLNELLGKAVQRVGRLIEHQDPRSAEERSYHRARSVQIQLFQTVTKYSNAYARPDSNPLLTADEMGQLHRVSLKRNRANVPSQYRAAISNVSAQTGEG